jgi:hypothetical protein
MTALDSDISLVKIERNKRFGVLLDTNLLLLDLIGQFNREHISRFKRTQTFTPTDYDLLRKVLSAFVSIDPPTFGEVTSSEAPVNDNLNAGGLPNCGGNPP